MDFSHILTIVIDKLEFFIGLIVGLLGSVYSWYQRKVELKSKLYYPLFISCDNLLYIFKNIESLKNNEEYGKELYSNAVKYLDDIMNSYGTVVNLKSKKKHQEESYLSKYFKVKRIVDLNQNPINHNWAKATILFENGIEKKYNGNDQEIISKIKDFNYLYRNLIDLQNLCVDKDKTLKDQGTIPKSSDFPFFFKKSLKICSVIW